MRSVPWAKCGNFNLRGKKTKRIYAGKYVEDVIINHRNAERIRLLDAEAREAER